MTGFFDNLSSPTWWVGVVIVGILINLVSAYLKPRLDIFFSSGSSWWARRSQEKQLQRKARIERMKADPHEQLITAFTELRIRVRGLGFILLGLFVFTAATFAVGSGMGVIVSKLLLLLSAISILMGLTDQLDAIRLKVELKEARGENG